jgi:hypothetical protein
MKTSEQQQRPGNQDEESQIQRTSSSADATEDDGTPVLDEIDVEENSLTPDEADNIEWDVPEGNAGDR